MTGTNEPSGPWTIAHNRPAGVCVAEPTSGPISEAELSTIWQGKRYPAGALTWADGSAVDVLYPGRKGAGPGPDFRDAVVRIDGREERGDVELHVRASYFLQHRHHFDPAYDRLVLHAVFLDDAGGFSPLPGGGRVPVASFAPWVRERAADIAAWSLKPPLWREPCQTAASRLGEAAVSLELHGAGTARFLARSRMLGLQVLAEGPEQALWRAVLEALGYGGDRDGYRRLAEALPAALLLEIRRRDGEAAVFPALIAGAGLAMPPGAAAVATRLSPPLRRPVSRPANQPEKRLAAAARIIAGAGSSLAGKAAADVGGAHDAAGLLRAWTVPPMGAARAAEVLLNAVLPFVAAIAPDLEARCLDLAAGLRALPPYGKTLFLERNLAPSRGRRRPANALEQQGLLALHAEWCSQGGCGRCPLS